MRTITPVFARDPDEFRFFLVTLVERNLLDGSFMSIGGLGPLRLTPEGWERVEQLGKIQRDSNQAFVAMWFSEDLKPAWEEGLKPALESMGFKVYRADLDPHNDKIDDRIIAEIRRSSLLVADFTGNRGGVYFEAGFALGLGIPVIWTCRDTDIEKIHFDTRQYNHIVWVTPQDLKANLEYRIGATIPGRGKPN